MWPTIFDRENECWVVGDYSRSGTGEFFFHKDALHECAVLNSRLRRIAVAEPTTRAGRVADHDQYDETVWPGGLVSYGVSYG